MRSVPVTLIVASVVTLNAAVVAVAVGLFADTDEASFPAQVVVGGPITATSPVTTSPVTTSAGTTSPAATTPVATQPTGTPTQTSTRSGTSGSSGSSHSNGTSSLLPPAPRVGDDPSGDRDDDGTDDRGGDDDDDDR